MPVSSSCERESVEIGSLVCWLENSYPEYVDEWNIKLSRAWPGSYPRTAPCVGSRPHRRRYHIYRRTTANPSCVPHRVILGAGSHDRAICRRPSSGGPESADVELAGRAPRVRRLHHVDRPRRAIDHQCTPPLAHSRPQRRLATIGVAAAVCRNRTW